MGPSRICADDSVVGRIPHRIQEQKLVQGCDMLTHRSVALLLYKREIHLDAVPANDTILSMNDHKMCATNLSCVIKLSFVKNQYFDLLRQKKLQKLLVKPEKKCL